MLMVNTLIYYKIVELMLCNTRKFLETHTVVVIKLDETLATKPSLTLRVRRQYVDVIFRSSTLCDNGYG